jgi:flagellin
MSNTVVRTNVMALNSHRNLGLVGNQQARASQRLSSGFRINSAADDAAGLAISEGMRAQIRGMNQASRNAQDGISLIQTAEGYMQTITEMVQRARELAVQAGNDTYSDDNRITIRNEVQQLSREIGRVWTTATFNGEQLFSITAGVNALPQTGGAALFSNNFNLQVGPDSGHGLGLNIRTQVDALHANLTYSAETALGGGMSGPNGAWGIVSQWDNHAGIQGVITRMDNTFDLINGLRAALGAYQNRLEFTIQNLDIASENLSASESRIRDADMAQEMMRLTQANVLQQAATAMLAQANQAPQSILQLLG